MYQPRPYLAAPGVALFLLPSCEKNRTVPGKPAATLLNVSYDPTREFYAEPADWQKKIPNNSRSHTSTIADGGIFDRIYQP